MKMEEIEELIDRTDYNRNGYIQYTESIAAILDTEKVFKENEGLLKQIFDIFDNDKSGNICAEDIVNGFKRLG